MGPQAILESMNGVMAAQAAQLTPRQKQDVAEFLSGRALASETISYSPPMCDQTELDMDHPPRQIGFGIDEVNSRFRIHA